MLLILDQKYTNCAGLKPLNHGGSIMIPWNCCVKFVVHIKVNSNSFGMIIILGSGTNLSWCFFRICGASILAIFLLSCLYQNKKKIKFIDIMRKNV